jgi:hypothetical protein
MLSAKTELLLIDVQQAIGAGMFWRQFAGTGPPYEALIGGCRGAL